MRNSAAAVAGSRPIRAKPPKMNSVILRTGNPSRRATTECPSSWVTTDAKKRMVVATAVTQ